MKFTSVCKKASVLLIATLALCALSCKGKEKQSGSSEKVMPKSTSKDKVAVGYNVYEPSSRLDEEGKPDTIYVSFDGSVAKIEDVGQAPSSDISITPAIAGSWLWVDDSSLRFTPAENWKLDTKYKVDMPAEIFSDSVSVRNDFTFKTDSFSVWLTDEEFYINPENPNEKCVTCTVGTSHPMVKDSLQKAVSMSLVYLDSKGKTSKTDSISYKVSFNKTATAAYLVSDPLPIPPYTSLLKINLAKGVEAQVGGSSTESDSTSVSVPGMSDFVKIRDLTTSLVKNDEQNYDQMLVIESKGSV
ncbi:MAG: hypothetical protein K6C97_12230, partial [Treponema sp.]|nr:hypothetical protein [Treponema sp.]